ncbi:MAG: hypothetical protein O9256_00625 [Rhizobiaceae bacterium]|nr:hypothetical protein [Rhizobiaceae bacterium]
MASYFPRVALAEEMVVATSGESDFSDASAGLFIAAPRRTGKTTFILGDLIPAFERAGLVTAYVDLWANRDADPFDLVAYAIASALAEAQAPLRRAAGIAAGLIAAVTIKDVTVDLREVGTVAHATLADALKELHKASAKPVALIIDEAQHALTSQRGDALMFALKSARDQMNMPGKAMLRLVMSGSDRDKLLRLTNTSAAPFYGASIKAMPLLKEDYIEHIASGLEWSNPKLQPVNRAKLMEAFDRFARRPEPFVKAYREALDPFADDAGTAPFEERVLNAADRHVSQEAADYRSMFLGLTKVQQAVVARMLEKQDTYRPMDADALAFYRDFVGSDVNTNAVNSALQSLRENSPPIVWKSNRGEYALSDSGMDRWYANCRDAGLWPP